MRELDRVVAPKELAQPVQRHLEGVARGVAFGLRPQRAGDRVAAHALGAQRNERLEQVEHTPLCLAGVAQDLAVHDDLKAAKHVNPDRPRPRLDVRRRGAHAARRDEPRGELGLDAGFQRLGAQPGHQVGEPEGRADAIRAPAGRECFPQRFAARVAPPREEQDLRLDEQRQDADRAPIQTA